MNDMSFLIDEMVWHYGPHSLTEDQARAAAAAAIRLFMYSMDAMQWFQITGAMPTEVNVPLSGRMV